MNNNTLLKKYLKGIKLKELASQEKCSIGKIYSRLKKEAKQQGVILKKQSQTNDEALLKRYMEGIKLKELATQEKCSIGKIYSRLKKEAKRQQVKLRRYSPRIILLEQYQKGKTYKELAQMTGYTTNTIRKYIKEDAILQKIQLRDPDQTKSKVDLDRLEVIKQLLSQKLSHRQIAQRLKVSKQRVQQIIKKHKL